MKICILLMVFITNQSLACDWSSIKKQGSSYVYTASCHKLVGSTVKRVKALEKANSERQKQAEKLTKAIELKDLALDKADERIMNWRKESYNQHERLLKQKKYSAWNDWLYFGGGIGLTVLSVWAAGQIK